MVVVVVVVEEEEGWEEETRKARFYRLNLPGRGAL